MSLGLDGPDRGYGMDGHNSMLRGASPASDQAGWQPRRQPRLSWGALSVKSHQ